MQPISLSTGDTPSLTPSPRLQAKFTHVSHGLQTNLTRKRPPGKGPGSATSWPPALGGWYSVNLVSDTAFHPHPDIPVGGGEGIVLSPRLRTPLWGLPVSR